MKVPSFSPTYRRTSVWGCYRLLCCRGLLTEHRTTHILNCLTIFNIPEINVFLGGYFTSIGAEVAQSV
jgi:hypothetical protein